MSSAIKKHRGINARHGKQGARFKSRPGIGSNNLKASVRPDAKCSRGGGRRGNGVGAA